MTQKEFFINAVPMIDVEGNTSFPTVLLYQVSGKRQFGFAALSAAKGRHELHADFKVDLGNVEPGSFHPRSEDTDSKSAVALTSDFFHEVLGHVRQWLVNSELGPDAAESVLLAEPLAMQTGLVSGNWLSNYRRNLDRIFKGRGFTNVDFLPEPFAVFQYYRYGLRHPAVAERGKKQALVIDFGGGTCDICVIETTKEGDISLSGRNAKPLAASSIAVGGFYINRIIAVELLRRHSDQRDGKQKITKAFEIYNQWRKRRRDLSSLSADYVNFVRSIDSLTFDVEDLKLALCRTISDWSLDAAISGTAPIAIPPNPFGAVGKRINASFSVADLRTLFISAIWEPHIRPAIRLALRRAFDELQGAPITVVLLSGGSANIGWLRELMLRDFTSEFSEADILRLPDFQEVVAKGLAVECARRFYSADGDFSSQTYNRLCLILNPDEAGHQLKLFTLRTPAVPIPNIPGVLLPSASALRNLIDRPIRWRVKLDRPPRHKLNYYFLRSSLDPDDIENLQNGECPGAC